MHAYRRFILFVYRTAAEGVTERQYGVGAARRAEAFNGLASEEGRRGIGFTIATMATDMLMRRTYNIMTPAEVSSAKATRAGTAPARERKKDMNIWAPRWFLALCADD